MPTIHPTKLHQATIEWVRLKQIDAGSDLRTFVARYPSFADELLLELVIFEFDLQSCSGDQLPIEVWLRKFFPEFTQNESIVRELVLVEILRSPARPIEQKYVKRFPGCEAAVRFVFAMLPPLDAREFSDISKSFRDRLDQIRADSLRRAERGACETDNGGEVLSLENGTVLASMDSYLIERKIGQGGNKHVYSARQASTGQEVALKQLRHDSSEDRLYFVSEGRIQSRLKHQNIPPILQLGPVADQPTMLLEKLINAPDWSETIHASDQPEAERLLKNLEILRTVAVAAAAAHKAGVIHRDIKPQNVLVGEFSEVYLADWGTAVLAHGRAASNNGRDDGIRTLEAETRWSEVGTPAYMSPEQALGHWDRCSYATDVFQLGAILYEILSGHPPYGGLRRTAQLQAARARFQPLGEELPPELVWIARRSMAESPEDRFEDAGEFAAAIDAYLRHREAEGLYLRTHKALSEIKVRLASSCPSSDDHSLSNGLIVAAEQFRQVTALWRESRNTPEVKVGRVAEETNGRRHGHLPTVDKFVHDGIARAVDGEREARRVLTKYALDKGDLGLANEQLGELTRLTPHEDVQPLKAILDSRRRGRRAARVALVTSTLAAALAVLVAIWMRVHADEIAAQKTIVERDRDLAEIRRDLAVQNELTAAERAMLEEERRKRAESEARFAEIQRHRAEAQPLLQKAELCRTANFTSAEAAYLSEALPGLSGSEQTDAALRLAKSLQNSLVVKDISPRRIFSERGIWRSNGDRIVTADRRDSQIQVWDAHSLELTNVLSGHTIPTDRGGPYGAITGLVADPGKPESFYSCGLDGTVRRWNVNGHVSEAAASPASDLKPKWVSLALSPAEATVAEDSLLLGDQNGNIVRVHASSLQETGRLTAAHDGAIRAIAVSISGQIGSGDVEGSVRLWTSSLQPIRKLDRAGDSRDAPVRVVRFSSDGQRLAVAGEFRHIEIHEVESGDLLGRLAGHDYREDEKPLTTDLWFSGSEIFSTGQDGLIRIWQLPQPQGGQDDWAQVVSKNCVGHERNRFGAQAARSLALHPAGNRILSVGADNTIRIWNRDDRTQLARLAGWDTRPDSPTRLESDSISAFSRDSGILISAGFSVDAYVRVWSLPELREVKHFLDLHELEGTNEQFPVHALALTSDGSRFALADHKGRISVRSTVDGSLQWQADAHVVFEALKMADGSENPLPPATIAALTWTRDGKSLISSGYDSRLKIWNGDDGSLIREWDAVDPDHPREGGLLNRVVRGPNGEVTRERVILKATDELLVPLQGDRLLTAGRDGILRLWNVTDGTLVRRVNEVADRISCLDVDEDQKLIVTGNTNGELQLWDAQALTIFARIDVRSIPVDFEDHSRKSNRTSTVLSDKSRVVSVALNRGTDRVAAFFGDGTIGVVDLNNGRIVSRGYGHEGPAKPFRHTDLYFTANDALISVDSDLAIRRWEIAGPPSHVLRTIEAPTQQDRVWNVATRSDGGWNAIDVSGRVLADIQDDFSAAASWAPELDRSWALRELTDGRILAATYFGRAFVWNPRSKQADLFLPSEGERVFPDKSSLQRIQQDPAFSDSIGVQSLVAYSASAGLAASCWRDGVIDLWNPDTRASRHTLQLPPPDHTSMRTDGESIVRGRLFRRRVAGLEFSPDGTQLAAMTDYGELFVWKMNMEGDPELGHRLYAKAGGTDLVWTSDGRRLIQCGAGGISVWDITRETVVIQLPGHDPVEFQPGALSAGVLRLAARSQDGLLATAGTDATIRFWRIDAEHDELKPLGLLSLLPWNKERRTGTFVRDSKQVGVLPGECLDTEMFRDLAFSEDGAELAVVNSIGNIILIDVQAILDWNQSLIESGREMAKHATGLSVDANQQLTVRYRNRLQESK